MEVTKDDLKFSGHYPVVHVLWHSSQGDIFARPYYRRSYHLRNRQRNGIKQEEEEDDDDDEESGKRYLNKWVVQWQCYTMLFISVQYDSLLLSRPEKSVNNFRRSFIQLNYIILFY